MTPVERLLAKLPDARRAGKGWSARCPAHEDRRASLSIGEGEDGRTSYLKLIDRFQPCYFIHGHIHAHFSDPSQRVSVVGKTQVINTFAYHLLEVDHG